MAIKKLTRAQLLKEYTKTKEILRLKKPHLGVSRMKVAELRNALKELQSMSPRVEDSSSDWNLPKRHNVWNRLKEMGLTKGLNYRKTKTEDLLLKAANNNINIPMTPKEVIQIRNPITGRDMAPEELAKLVKVGYRVRSTGLAPPKGKSLKMILPDNVALRDNGQPYYMFNLSKEMLGRYKYGIIEWTFRRGIDFGRGIEYFPLIDTHSATDKLYYLLYRYNEANEDGEGDYQIDVRKTTLRLVERSNDLAFGISYREEEDLHHGRVMEMLEASNPDPGYFSPDRYQTFSDLIKRYDISYEYEDDTCMPNRYMPPSKFKKNCVISAIEKCLRIDLYHLHQEYACGVSQSDFEAIAKAIKYVIKLHVHKSIIMYGEEFLKRKRKHLHLKYINNHVIVYKDTPKDIVRVDNINLDQILQTEDITEIENLQITKDGIIGVEFRETQYMLSSQLIGKDIIPIESNYPTVISEHKYQFIEMNNIIPCTLPLAANLCRHGIMIINKDDSNGFTLDCVNAYGNFMNNEFYEGIPLDISFEVDRPNNNADIKYILENHAGFGFCDWTNLYTGQLEQRWVSIPQIKARLYMKKYYNVGVVKVKKFALAFSKTNTLDMTVFAGKDKRLFHKVLGSMSKTHKYTSITTTDAVSAESNGLVKYHTHNGTSIYYGLSEVIEFPKVYTHVTAYIQCYTEIALESAYLLASERIENFADKITSIFVDGISTTCTKEELLSIDLDNNLYHIKKNKNMGWTTDGMDRSYVHVDYVPCTNKFVQIPVHGSNRYKVIDGPAGSGKSTLIKNFRKMMPDVKILVQSNQQKDIFIKDGFHNVDTVDMYLTERLNGSKPYDQFVVIDEYFQMDVNKLLKFKSALLFGNCDQLSIGRNIINMRDYDFHKLTKCYRFDADVQQISQNILKNFDYSGIDFIEIREALLNGYKVLSCKHDIIEKINDIGLTLNLPKVIRWTKTDLSQGVYAGDLGEYRGGLCHNFRNGRTYKSKPGRIIGLKHPSIVYSYAQTYHSTQGQEFPKVCCILDGLDATKKKYLYTGVTRICVPFGRAIDGVKLCSLEGTQARTKTSIWCIPR